MSKNEKIDPTIELIRRLTQSEKRFVLKKILKSKSSKTHYILLKIILKDNSLNEKNIKNEFLAITHSRYYSIVKSQLKDIVLGYLINISESTDIEKHLLRRITEAEILLNKSLNKQALKIFLSVVKTASKLDFLHIKLRVFDLIINASMQFEPSTRLKEFLVELNGVINTLNTYTAIIGNKVFFNEICFEETDNEKIEAGYNKIEKAFQKIDISRCDNLKSEVFHYNMLGLLAMRYYKDYTKAASMFLTALNRMDSSPHLLVYNVDVYLSTLHHIAFCYNMLNDEKKFNEIMDKLISVSIQGENIEVKKLERYIMNIQAFYIQRKRYQEVIGLLRKKEREIFQYANLMQRGLCLAIFTNNVIANLFTHNYRQSLKWVNYILNNKFFVHYNHQSMIKIMNLIIHYELGHFDLIESLLPNTMRFLVRHNYYDGVYKASLLFFNKHMIELAEGDFKSPFRHLKEEIESLPDTSDLSSREMRGLVLDWISEKL